jgi:hypothetical protein
MEVNFHTENVQFEVAEVNLPFNAIIGRPALYRFMAVAHYGHLVLKMPSPAGVLTVQDDRTAAVAAVEKLHALAAGLVPAAGAEGSDPSPSRARAPAKAPKVHPSDTECSHEDHLGWSGALPDHPHRGEPGGEIGKCTHCLPPGKC